MTKQSAAENSGWMLFQNPVGASPAIEFGLIGTSAQTFALARTNSISMGTWHYVVATYSGTSTTAGMNIYVDGVPQTLTSISNNLSTTILNNLAPAINSRATADLESSDGMDELRVSTKGVVLTPAWVTASYNNESSPATFFGVTTGLTNQGGGTAPAALLTSSLPFPSTPSGTTSAALAATLSTPAMAR